MQKYRDVVLDAKGNAIASASVLVKVGETGLTASIYTNDAASPTAATNPLTTNANGEFEFYAPDGNYTLVISGASFATKTLENVILYDPYNDDEDDEHFDSFAGVTNVKDYRAAGDGVTDDSAVFLTVDSMGKKVFVPDGVYDTAIPAEDLNGPYWGTGQIRDSSNYKRAPYFSLVRAAPSSLGAHGSINQAFNGDISKVQFPIEHRIYGDATLGQPTSGYVYTPEAYAAYEYLQNTSGYNHDTASNDGRTLAAFRQTRVYQAGQGDCAARSVIGFVSSTKTGSTNFLANPAVTAEYVQLTAGVNGAYLNPHETYLQDGGYDVAAIGFVHNYNRTVATGAKSAVWIGARHQNIGSAYMDNIISAIGKFKVGIDFAMSSLDLDTTAAAISMRSGQRVYFNNTAGADGDLDANWRTTVFNNDYQYYGADVDNGTGLHFIINSEKTLSVRSDAVVLKNSNGLVLKGTGLLRFSGIGQSGTGSQTAAISTTNFPGSAPAGSTKWLFTVLADGKTYGVPALEVTP